MLHARNDARAADARAALPDAEDVVVGDLSSLAEIRRSLTGQRARPASTPSSTTPRSAIASRGGSRPVDGLDQVFAVNVLAPYLLTALIELPRG